MIKVLLALANGHREVIEVEHLHDCLEFNRMLPPPIESAFSWEGLPPENSTTFERRSFRLYVVRAPNGRHTGYFYVEAGKDFDKIGDAVLADINYFVRNGLAVLVNQRRSNAT